MADRSFLAFLFDGTHGLAVQIMLGVQVAVLVLVAYYTVWPLFLGRRALQSDADVLRETGPADPGTRVSEPTRRAWAASVLRSRELAGALRLWSARESFDHMGLCQRPLRVGRAFSSDNANSS